jgi:hypothetical protein
MKKQVFKSLIGNLSLFGLISIAFLAGCGDRYDKNELADCYGFFYISGDIRKGEGNVNEAIFYWELKNAIVKIAESKGLYDSDRFRDSHNKMREYARQERVESIRAQQQICENLIKTKSVKKEHQERMLQHMKNGTYTTK